MARWIRPRWAMMDGESVSCFLMENPSGRMDALSRVLPKKVSVYITVSHTDLQTNPRIMQHMD
jgi:hypothetical protein